MSTKQKMQDTEETTEQEIPVLTVDEAASVEDRLTPAVQNQILPSRYLEKDSDGNVTETPAELFERVADNVATAEYQFAQERGLSRDEQHEIFEEWRDEFEDLMKTQRFMPNSPTLMNAGLPLQQLSACFVNSPKDDLEDIAQTEKEWTMVQKTGGGMGGAFHHLRPKGTLISTTKGVSSGPVSFMTKFDQVAGVIKQGGKRRGAQMAIMRVDHPDIGRFAVCKRREGDFDNFNISTGITDEFKEAVQNDEQYTLYAPQSDFEETFEYVEETVNFYSPKKQKAHENVVDENLWRDYADDIEAWDWENEETISFREKWEDRFEKAAGNGTLAVGEPMELPARFIWDILIDGAWRNGEPGLFYLDETNRKHSFDVEEHPEYYIDGTNPCLTGDTLVNTPDGPRTAESIEEGDVISTTRGGETVDDVLTFDNREVYEVEFSDGGRLKATEDHRFHTLDGKRSIDKPLRDIEEGEYIRLHPSFMDDSGTETQYKRQLRRGILVGDGCYTEDTIKHNNTVSISTSEADSAYNEQLVTLFEDAGYTVTEDRSGGGNSMKYWVGPAEELIQEHSLEPSKSHEKSVDVSQFETESQIIGFLDGLLASDGNVNLSTNRPQVRWTSSSDELVQNVRTLALNIGAHARIYEDQRAERVGQRNDGSKILGERSVSDVHIAGESLREYASKSRIDDIHPAKGSLLREAQDSWALTGGSWKAQVESIEKSRTADTVYDLYCSGSDTWITEGYVQRGCAEQPLCEYEACNLGHINLSLMLEEDAPTYDEWRDSINYNYTSESAAVYDYFEEAVDFDQFDRTIESGTRFLDNVVTMSEFPLEKIEERVRNMRKIGLGVMGWAQMCYQMGIRYGSDSSFELGRIIMSYIDETATKYSHELAEERGSFEVWEKSKYADPTEYPEWFKSHAYDIPELWEDGYPMRNHNVTTVAPTGTTSMLGDTSGGIEPVHAVAFAKNVGEDIRGDDLLMEYDKVFLNTVEANEEKIGMTVDDMKQLIREQIASNEFEGIHGLPVPDWMKEKFVTTDRLTSEEHGKMQRVFQEGVDSGISKCVAKGTVIKTDDGLERIETLGDATDVPAETFANSSNTTIDGDDVTEHYNAGEKPATRVRFDNGQTLTAATGSHRVKTTDGWKTVGNLQPGDVVRGSYSESHGESGSVIHWNPENNTNSNNIEPPAQLSPELSEWLGMVAADGSLIEETGKVGITHKNETVGKRFTELTRECFDTEPKTRIDKRNDVESVYLTSRDLYRWVTDLIGDGAYNKQVPDIVLGGSEDEKRAFVEGLTLDGYIHENGLAVYEGMSEQLARDTASMLQSFGKPRVYVSRKYVSESDSMAYGVIVSNELHDEIVPVEPHKQVDTIDVRYKVYAPTESYSLDDYETGSDQYYAARSALNRGNNYLFNETAEKLGVDVEEPVYKVTDVEAVGNVQMYDIEVEDSHEYVSNGVQSHNTINLPKEANHSDVHDAYMLALTDDEIGAPIKGLTVYRDQSREKQVVTTQQYSDIEIENAVDMFDDLEEYAVIQEDDLPESIDPNTFIEEVLGELNWKQKLNLSTETDE